MKIIDKIIQERNGHYCHVIEVNEVYEIENIIELIHDEFIDSFKLEDIIEFFSNISIYSLNDDNEDEIYNFDTTKHIKEFYA